MVSLVDVLSCSYSAPKGAVVEKWVNETNVRYSLRSVASTHCIPLSGGQFYAVKVIKTVPGTVYRILNALGLPTRFRLERVGFCHFEKNAVYGFVNLRPTIMCSTVYRGFFHVEGSKARPTNRHPIFVPPSPFPARHDRSKERLSHRNQRNLVDAARSAGRTYNLHLWSIQYSQL